MAYSYFSFTEPLNSGIDFYTADANDTIVVVSAEGLVQATATRIALGATAASGSADLSATTTKIILIAIDIQVSGATLTLATERQDGAIVINAISNLTANGTKLAYSASDISGSVSATTSGTKIIHIASNISASASASASMIKTSAAASAMSVESALAVIGAKVISISSTLSATSSMSLVGNISLATIRIQIFPNLTVSAKPIKFSTVTGVDTTTSRTLLILDGKPITDQNRQLEISTIPMFIENRNWAGNSSRYYKNQTSAVKKTFSLSWRFIPNFREKTVDQKHSRDFLRSISLDPDVHTLKIINQDSSGVTPYTETVYNVFVKDFSENLVRRDVPDNTYYFDCSIVLEEA